MIKRPYQSMSFNGSAGRRSAGGSGFGGGKPWERGGDRGGDRRSGGSDRRSGGFGGGARSGGFGGGRSGGFGGGRPSGDREMHDATCNSCGNSCQVPFRPNGSKPIYCSNCFKKEDSFGSNDRPSFGGDRGGFGGDRFSDRGGRDGFPEKRLFKAECAKCHSECEVPFRPNGEKPVYCRACFGQSEVGAKAAAASDVTMHKLNEQFKLLNAKLDLIIEAIGIGEDEEEDGDEIVFEDEDEIDEDAEAIDEAAPEAVVDAETQA